MLLPGGRNWQLIYHTGATTPSIMTINIMGFRITIKNATLNITAPNTDCCYAECHYDVCHYTECHCAERHCAECHYAECRGTILIIGSLRSPYFFTSNCRPNCYFSSYSHYFYGIAILQQTSIENFQPYDKFHL